MITYNSTTKKTAIYPLFLGATDFYPFGMTMPGRKNTPESYRYGFGGHEKDDEVKGSSNHLSFGDYGYDPRLGRRWNLDPIDQIGISNYAVFANNPIRYIDPTGMVWEDTEGNDISDKSHENVKVYIFYDPTDFSEQSKKMAEGIENKYGKGTVALSSAMTESEFSDDWKNMSSNSIEEVNLNYHGSNQQIHLDWRESEYIVSTENGHTSSQHNPGTDIKNLPKPKGNVQNAILKVNACHSTDRNDKDMPLVGSGLTVADSFRKYTDFKTIRGTSGGVNYDSNGESTTQWYYGYFWKYFQKEVKPATNAPAKPPTK